MSLYRHAGVNWEPVFPTDDRPKIVCICGSTRFSEAWQAALLEETIAGHIALTVGCLTAGDDALFGDLDEAKFAELKQHFDHLHLRKIDLSDEILVLNVGGYIGNSTANEINYATSKGKPIRYLEPIL